MRSLSFRGVYRSINRSINSCLKCLPSCPALLLPPHTHTPTTPVFRSQVALSHSWPWYMLFHSSPACPFFIAAVTSYPKVCGLKQYKCILLQFWGSEVQNGSAGLCSFWRSRGGSIPLPFPASRGFFGSWPPSSNDITLTPASVVTSPLTLTLPPPSCEDRWAALHPPRHPRRLARLKTLNPNTSFLPRKVTYSQNLWPFLGAVYSAVTPHNPTPVLRI